MIPVPLHISPLPGAEIISKLTADGLLWRHKHMGQPLAIVTSQWPIVPTGIYGRMIVHFPLHFRTPVFQHRASLVIVIIKLFTLQPTYGGYDP